MTIAEALQAANQKERACLEAYGQAVASVKNPRTTRKALLKLLKTAEQDYVLALRQLHTAHKEAETA